MRNIVIALLFALVLAGCGNGTYTVASGKMDQGSISFTVATDKTTSDAPTVSAVIDGKTYNVQAVSNKEWRVRRDIKKTALNTIDIASGTHEVKVVMNGQEVYSRKVIISSGEHKVIEL